MSGGGLLRPEDVEAFESYLGEGTGDFAGLLECIGRTISAGAAEGRFTEKQARADLGFALWVGYACNNCDDYEHYCTACDWLSAVEQQASGCGVWHYRYANALMYCGKPRLALEYASRGVSEDPDYPWCWLTLGRLRAHFGDAEGAAAAALRGLQLVPDDPEFLGLLDDLSAGRTLEEMEFRFIDPGRDPGVQGTVQEAFWYGDGEPSSRAEAVMGICVDEEGLAAAKAALSPEGWIADHPYCTYMARTPSGQVLVTLAMNEAFLSKMPPESLARIAGSLPEMEAAARDTLPPASASRPLYGLTVDRRLRPMLSFGGFGEDSPVTVSFDQDLQVARRDAQGGPFVAIVLLGEGGCDLGEVKGRLLRDWGVACSEDPEDGSLVFECDGHLAAYSLVDGPVPGSEAEENAANNYMWPGAVLAASMHRSHLLVALVNHGGTPVEAAVLHTRMVAAACSDPNALGVYFQGSVVSPEAYLEEAGSIRSGGLPVLDWVWIGLYRGEDGGICAYTRGMSAFGRDEMEVTGARDSPERVRDFVYSIARHVLENDVFLSDGDELWFSEEESVRVGRSPGLSVDGPSLKIAYPRRRLPAVS